MRRPENKNLHSLIPKMLYLLCIVRMAKQLLHRRVSGLMEPTNGLYGYGTWRPENTKLCLQDMPMAFGVLRIVRMAKQSLL